MDDYIKYLNELLRVGLNNPYKGPKTLFRYREFNDYNIDSLLNNYVFMCPAEMLDDETECAVSVNTSQIGNLDTGFIKREFVWRVVEMIRPYCNDEVFGEVTKIVSSLMQGNGDIKRNFLIDDAYKIQELAPEIDHVLLINVLANITDIPEKPEESKKIKTLILTDYVQEKQLVFVL